MIFAKGARGANEKPEKKPPTQIRYNLETSLIEESVKFEDFRCEKEKFLPTRTLSFFRNYVKNVQSWTQIPQEVKLKSYLSIFETNIILRKKY